MNAGGKWISFIAEGLDIHGKLQLTIQVWYTEKTMGTTFPLFKKRTGMAFPSDSNTGISTVSFLQLGSGSQSYTPSSGTPSRSGHSAPRLAKISRAIKALSGGISP